MWAMMPVPSQQRPPTKMSVPWEAIELGIELAKSSFIFEINVALRNARNKKRYCRSCKKAPHDLN
jgi:hypothetical protein